MGPDTRQHRFVSAVLELISAAGLNAVVEGIETAEQADQLRAMGCLYGQGYYFARPLPAAEALDYLRSSALRR
jgi:EAL domain-containing protein (putative c-di-GMP-specific phosphodiesterase class I)